MHNTIFVSVDVETTGLDPKKDKIIEIGSIKIDVNGFKLDEFSELANPGFPLPEKIIKLTNIDDEMLKDKKYSNDVVADWANWLNKTDNECILFAHNAPFDLKFIKEHLKGIEIEIDNYYVVDTLTWSRKDIKKSSNHQLGTLLEYLNFEKTGDLHRATFDSLGSMFIASQILKKVYKTKSIEDVIDVLDSRKKLVKDIIK